MQIKFQYEQVQLLELFSSTYYFGALRDKWEEIIEHVDSCLEAYVAKLPPNYRSKPLPDQPDVTWGNRVLPNFQRTLEKLNQAYIMLTHGDISALGYANSVRSDFKGQLDYIADWMSENDRKTYEDNIYSAVSMAHNIILTDEGAWQSLESILTQEELSPFLSSLLPRNYRRNMRVAVRSGEKTKVSGVYVPDMEQTCPQFLGTHRKCAPLTSVCIGAEDLLDPRTNEKYDQQKIYKRVECTWYLIEHDDKNDAFNLRANETYEYLKVGAGDLCPKTGFYFSPALPSSRKYFIKSELMPSLDSTYGKTIWQWDEVQ
ncbi:hypothetical protein [Massilia sp. IC2-476]|uniref:hypothetical protein n=1 Tax=Massilia sp. IC2-476 TaxID=2887199 RepID=UPI001D1150AF|nr:hypothetical protein [Massilia sp. IC2-476]MCC2972913.1 hypothetical protein [Massilia sp. IC2-476]